MKKLFENINGNQFKLITENTDDVPKSTLVREGLKKVLSSGGKELSYRQLETVGLGYIRNVEEAKKCALREAREIASEYGYKDNEDSQKFVKEVSWSDEESYKRSHGDNETDMSNPEEKREVQIGKIIYDLTKTLPAGTIEELDAIKEIRELTQELIKMHGVK